ncbi:MAG TPA: L,D-transpeptidase, partial [Acidimicrobiales bacterium]|nr:L,D-transpeptidase [Acidimicrobiales bacterium]
ARHSDEIARVPQPGSFSWRYSNIPASLASLWRPGVDTVLVQGAVMAFESDHGLDDDAVLTPAFWEDMFESVAHRQVSTSPYDYLQVSTALPETLSVWRDGRVIFQTPVNTGIPEAPTELGTYPVYARYFSTTMSGYNPDGSYYDDPGIPDVAYFNGGDAVHGFLRGAYGFPQSLGCVELPFAAAAVVFNEDPIGTLVSVE